MTEKLAMFIYRGAAFGAEGTAHTKSRRSCIMEHSRKEGKPGLGRPGQTVWDFASHQEDIDMCPERCGCHRRLFSTDRKGEWLGIDHT